jgi:hypothetical protein
VAVVALMSLLPGVLVPHVTQYPPQRAPPPGEHTTKDCTVVPPEVACSLVSTVQPAYIQCSCELCGEDEPSKIWKYERVG